jgi:DNA-binding NtrC family response regulator
VWQVLAARALGWLGEGAEARELLEGMPVGELTGIEPEERPAIWALAGDWARARESASAGAPGSLWRLALAGDAVPEDSWEALAQLDPYRAARMVFDFQLLLPGKVPSVWLDRAIQRLRAVGADSFAERLDRGRGGCWRALERYLNAPSIGNGDLGELFEVAGYFDVRLEWRNQVKGEVLVSGRGGVEELKVDRPDGRLQLSAGEMDPALKALFALAARDFRPPSLERSPGPSRVSGILGASDCLLKALDRLERLAGTDLAVLIQGETGTGKELAARQLHRLSSRSSQKLVALNCAALSESLLLSDLFGHIRGAFTGADRDRAGIFETAGGGSVLLDEIGDLPWAAQGKLLRVLQEGEVRRVGESLPRKVDVRVLAATHRDLESMVEKGTFRRDLFYRLKVSSLTLPPLRHREGDVLLLAEHFVSGSGHQLTRRAGQRLLKYHWPGNVRELRNVLQVAVALSDGSVVDLPGLELPRERRDRTLGYHAQVEELRCRLVREALAESGGHRARAARRLGVSRQALSYLVKRFDLEKT